MAAPKTLEALTLLAHGFEGQGCHAQAIKCMMAAANTCDMLPASEARVRLHLAKLLLQHTSNVSDAKAQLQRAVRTSAAIH